MDKLKLDAVVHWSIPVNDLEAAEKFYGEILGLEHVGRLANTPMSCFKLGNHNILLCQRNDPINRTVEQDGRLHHAFDVSPEMFDRACKLFHQLAIKIHEPVGFSPAGNSSFSIPAAIALNCATPVGRRACRRRRMRRSSIRDRIRRSCSWGRPNTNHEHDHKKGLSMGIRYLIAILLLSSSATFAAEKIRVSGGGMTPLHSLIWVANHEGLFKKYGMDVEYLAMNSGTLGVQTMLSNDSQFLFSTGALAVTANLQGADIAMITGGFNLFAFKVVGRPEIKSVQDLRGKKVSISQFGSATDFAVQASLEKFGVDPKQVTVIQLGSSSNRLTALTNGSTEASLFTEPFATMAIKKHRMGLLLDMAEAGMAYPQSCLMIKRSYLEANKERATNFVKALVEALFIAKRDRAMTIQVIKKYIRADDEVYGIGYDYFLGTHAEGLLSMPDRKGVELVIAQLAKTNPKAKGQTVESLRVMEPSILDELKRTGFIDKVRR